MKRYVTLLMLVVVANIVLSQSRIKFNGRDLFLNGSNIAWVNFASDIGPGTTNFTRFSQIFAELKNAGGNSMRFWLHTNGTKTPEFNSSGIVIGPGTNATSDLKQILDLAWQNKVGLLLCLWSHDMLRSSNGSLTLNRNKKLLTDTTAIRAYIDKALIPMINAVKGHPAIVAWEIFNEPEGMSDEFGWGGWDHVAMYHFQRFVNLTAAAIHRADPSAQVTNGSWGLAALTDVPTLAKQSFQNILSSFSDDKKQKIETAFVTKYGVFQSADDIIKQYNSINAVNYYRDDRLIAAGGDPDGTLDFYTVHYYDWAGTQLSPFHHNYSYWNLTKPLAIAEFFMEDAFGLSYKNLYEQLYTTGYAGALSWQWWGDTPENPYNGNHTRTVENLTFMYENFPSDVDPNPLTGKIYTFKASQDSIEKGDSVLISWKTAAGSTVTINGSSVQHEGSFYVYLNESTTYELITNGELPSNASLTIEVYPSGNIFSFQAFPSNIGIGESSMLKWNTSRGSGVTLNGIPVNEKDSMVVTLGVTTTYLLKTTGDVSDSSSLTVNVLPNELINRALHSIVSVSSSEEGKGNDDPSSIVDGNLSTRWSSSYADVQFVEIDLGSIYKITKVILRWADSYGKNYRIAAGIDNKNYKLVKSVSDGKGGTEIFDSLSSEGRFVKIFLDKRATTLGFSFYEVEVYGSRKETEVIHEQAVPEQYALNQNYPNPFNPETIISWQIPELSHTIIKLYNILGDEISTIVDNVYQPGKHSIKFRSDNLSSGVYFYKIEAGKFSAAKKMVILK